MNPENGLCLAAAFLRQLYYQIVPDAGKLGHPGTTGPSGNGQCAIPEEMMVDECINTLKALRPHVAKFQNIDIDADILKWNGKGRNIR